MLIPCRGNSRTAERVQTLWFSFLTFMLYLAVAIGTTTHRMLFREESLNLPVLNIALPLLGFYILTPVIFVVFHFYMLLNLVLLARTAKSFEDALMRPFPEDGEARENFRMRIEHTLFVQLLVGGRLEREGLNAKLLSLMALITLAVAPAALLLFLGSSSCPITAVKGSLGCIAVCWRSTWRSCGPYGRAIEAAGAFAYGRSAVGGSWCRE
jgi:hypothetical protein